MTARRQARSVCWVVSALALCAAACSSTGPKTEGAGGTGGEAASSTSSFATGSTTTGGETCDDLGAACGDDADPGCQGCAIEGACKPESDACRDAVGGDCLALNTCYLDCAEGEQACFDACDAQHPDGRGPLDALLLCLFCGQCPVSCHIDTSLCPGG